MGIVMRHPGPQVPVHRYALFMPTSLRTRGPLEEWHVVGEPGEPEWADPAAIFLASSTARFYLSTAGMVYVEAVVVLSGTAPLTLFTLPEGYRPAYTERQPNPRVNATASDRTVQPDGQVRMLERGTPGLGDRINMAFRAA